MQVKLAGVNLGAIVTFSPRAFADAMERHGKYELVMTWQQFKALALGVKDDAEGSEKHQKLREGLRFFAQRQGLNLVDF